jgi:catechol 2,3-dioxygenase-like lactoylglutathione lyase family enzyme
MEISSVIAQLRTTDLKESIRFYTQEIGLTLEFQYEDFYAGIRAGNQVFHLKLVDEKDPSIKCVDDGEHFHLYFGTDDVEATAEALRKRGIRFAKDVHETPWGTKEFVIKDNQGQSRAYLVLRWEPVGGISRAALDPCRIRSAHRCGRLPAR